MDPGLRRDDVPRVGPGSTFFPSQEEAVQAYVSAYGAEPLDPAKRHNPLETLTFGSRAEPWPGMLEGDGGPFDFHPQGEMRRSIAGTDHSNERRWWRRRIGGHGDAGCGFDVDQVGDSAGHGVTEETRLWRDSLTVDAG